jgi:hypothetical protein
MMVEWVVEWVVVLALFLSNERLWYPPLQVTTLILKQIR